ncbi:hypothetical protein DL96DRAFT_1825005 [Flagelloscypha sp. PMI_526]|nr:hypothetical protein DL96DRAFT_1825005 [Flagelloscypha sp. PMI_526]
MASTTVPQELVRLICSFSDPPTLSSICLSNRLFYLEASAALYQDLSFDAAERVEQFLHCAGDRFNLVKHLSLSIPSFPHEHFDTWKGFLMAITSPPNHPNIWPELQHLAGELVSLPSLKYLAVSTSVVFATAAV